MQRVVSSPRERRAIVPNERRSVGQCVISAFNRDDGRLGAGYSHKQASVSDRGHRTFTSIRSTWSQSSTRISSSVPWSARAISSPSRRARTRRFSPGCFVFVVVMPAALRRTDRPRSLDQRTSGGQLTDGRNPLIALTFREPMFAELVEQQRLSMQFTGMMDFAKGSTDPANSALAHIGPRRRFANEV